MDEDPTSRLAGAAARLKAAAPPAPDGELAVLEGLAHARLEVRRARARIAELEARLGAAPGPDAGPGGRRSLR
jgi:hypothetical protein